MAVVLAHAPPVLLLDEPTRGLDYPSKARLEQILRQLAADGTAVVVATHDVELVARVADRAVLLADGEVVADGRGTRGRVPLPGVRAPGRQGARTRATWLTVDEVARALSARRRADAKRRRP